MKTFYFIGLAALTVSIVTSSCSREGCTDPSAINYDKKADKDDGSCIPACTLTCLNGGTLTSNCSCDCPTGYTGENCGTAMTPTSMTITKIFSDIIPGISQTLYVNLKFTINEGQSSNENDYNSAYIPTTNFTLPECYPNKTIYSLNSDWNVSLWHQKTSNYNWYHWGGYYFRPSNHINSRPSSIVLYNSSTPDWKLTLSVTWNY